MKRLISLLTAIAVICISYVNCFAAAQTPELHTFNMVEDKNGPENIFDVSFVDEDGKSPDSYIRLKSFNNQLLQGTAVYPEKYTSEDWNYDQLPTETQGTSGICWAYSADYALGYHEMIKNEKTANEVNFSEYPLAYFGSESSKSVNDPLYNDGITSIGHYTLGSQYIWMTGLLTRGTGPYLESEFSTPDNPTGSETISFDESLRYNHSHGLVTGVEIVSDCGGTKTDAEKQADINAIKEAVMNNGAVSAAITVNNIFYNSSTGAYYEPRTGSSGHQVTIVGWDDNYSIENFNYKQVTYGDGTKYITRPENNGAWLVQNSWGTNSGDKGFMWLSYENAYINHVMSFSMEPGDKYDKIYQYDGFGYGRFAGYSDATKTYDVIGGNVFTAEKKQYISDVGFYSENKNLTGTVKVYRLSSGYSYPTSGTCVTSATIDFQLNSKGYFKIPLKTPVLMDKGQVFSVVISLHAPDGGMPLFCLEQTYNQSEDINVVYSSKAKQSYYGYINGTKTVWDTKCGTNGTGTSGNVCIKAYAQDYKPVVTWKMGDKTVKQTYRQGDSITAPEIYEPEKYRFNGWAENIPSVVSDTDLTFNAKYLYCPTYVWILNDETIVQNYVEGDSVFAPYSNPPEGYRLKSWSKTVPSVAGNEDLTFNAIYVPIGDEIKITHSAYISYPSAVSNLHSREYNQAPIEIPTLRSFEFLFYEDSNGVKYQPGESLAGSETLVAKFRMAKPANITIIDLIKNIVPWLIYPVIYSDYII